MAESVSIDFRANAAVTGPLHENLVGESAFIRETNDLINRLADSNLTVLITGETGTGKDIVARLLHRRSRRNPHPFVKVNCPALPHDLLESELFGYEKGAFTGARTAKPGRFEMADKGTIFLDEITEISANVQVKLMQVLDGEHFIRIGGTKAVQANARIVAATNIPADRAVSEGHLRKDISFRLSEFVIHMLPLRERPEDIGALMEHFNYNFRQHMEKEYSAIPAELVAAVQKQTLPGNVRELAARVKQFVSTGSVDALLEEQQDAPTAVSGPVSMESGSHEPTISEDTDGANGGPKEFISLKEAARQAVESTERVLIEEALQHTLWNRRKAAALLSISYSSLLRRIDAYAIGKS